MSTYPEHDIEKVSVVPLVHDTTHPDHTADDDEALGALVALDGAPVNGGVPTYDSGTGKHTSVVPGGSSTSTTDDPYTAALRMDGDARVREAGLSTTTTSTTSTYDPTTALQADGDARIREASLSGTSLTDDYIALLAQFYGA